MVKHRVAPLLVAAAMAALVSAQDRRAPNIVLIVADDLGYGDLGCYGQKVLRTPHIDRLAKEGLRFTDFYAGSTVCAPSRCVLMTGLHTGHCLIRGNGKQNLRPDDVTIAEVLKGAGYRTGCFGKWGIGHEESTGLPTRQGFDAFFGYLDQHQAHNYYPTFLIRNGERVALPNVVPKEGKWGQGVASKRVAYSHDLIVEEALSFIDANKDDPFFLFLPVTIPHANNEAGKRGMEVPELGPFADAPWPDPEKGFAAMMARLDRDVGRVRARIEKHGLAERTLILFTSDNGPHSEGGHRSGYFNSNGPLRGQKRDLLEGGIRVPLIAWWPGKTAGMTSHVADFTDLMPTLAQLGGATGHLPKQHDGVSFAPTLLGTPEDQKTRGHLYWAFYERGGAQAIRKGRWKAIQQPMKSSVRLYDLSTDLEEKTDLAGAQPELLAELTTLMNSSYTPSPRWRFK